MHTPIVFANTTTYQLITGASVRVEGGIGNEIVCEDWYPDYYETQMEESRIPQFLEK